jgi:hypothetical protein
MTKATERSTTNLTRRAALAGAPAAVAAAMVAGAAVNAIAVAVGSASEDHIFACIKEYEAAVCARRIALEATWDGYAGPELEAHLTENKHQAYWEAAEEAHDEAFAREWDTFDALFVTLPTTVGGVAALLDKLGTSPYAPDDPSDESVFEWAIGNQRENANHLLRTLATALRNMTGAPS